MSHAQLSLPPPAADRCTELFGRHGGACWALARQLLGSDDLAGPVVHEVFLEAARRPASTGTGAPTGAELLSCTHRRAVAVLRRRPSPARRPPSATEAAIDVAAEQSSALMLSYWSGYTQRELAALAGVTVAVVRARMLAEMTALTHARTDAGSVAAATVPRG